MKGSGRLCCLSSGPTLHKAVCLYPELMYSKKSLLCGPSESGMKAISGIRQLCLRQCFNILYAAAPIWCVTFPPWRAHHAYYCLLFWETPRRAVCRVKCKGFTERLCPPGPATQQLWLIKRILSTQEKKTCSPLPLDSQPTTPVLSLRRKRPTSKCQLSQELSPLFPQRKMSDGWWFSALWFHRSGDRTVWERYSVPVW